MDPLGLFDRLAEYRRRYQFRVPEWALWVAGVPAMTGVVLGILSSVPLALCSAVATVVIGTAIFKWRWHRRRSRGGLVVARFFAGQGAEGREEEVQRLVSKSLRDKLTEEEARLVHEVPVVVGADERDFAIALRRRLRARFLLHGRIAEGGDGYSVYARVAQPIDRGVIHIDQVTLDVTYEKASWRNLINRLTSARDVIDEEYPLEFANELEAVVRGTAGQLAQDRADHARAERLLRGALSVAPDSTSHQIDLLRSTLAKAIFYQDDQREDEAIEMIRERSADAEAAPELHRTLERLLFLQGGDERTAESRQEGERALRAAAAQRADPQLPLTLYNLAMLTDDDLEARMLLDGLLARIVQ